VHAALSTLRPAASPRTRAALDELLGPEAEPVEPDDDPGVELLRAQALWVDARVRLREGFPARVLDFADPGAPEVVNRWAADHTRGMIERILDGFEHDERLVLADALFFDGAWTAPFDPAATRPEPFAGRAAVPMMHAEGEMAYAEDDDVQAIRLPYGNTRTLRWCGVIAREGMQPPRLDAAAWSRLRFATRPGRLALPRLRLEARLDLREALIALGLGEAFTGDGFDKLFDAAEPATLGRVLQRARVDFDERGTRAAAVTVATMRLVAARRDPPPPFDVRLDRPFLWAIEHAPTGTLLFVGTVEDPGA
jgi:serine protease inhibitor